MRFSSSGSHVGPPQMKHVKWALILRQKDADITRLAEVEGGAVGEGGAECLAV